MAIERERGISVSSAVMSFEHEGLSFNLLDTPGHQDFSEDTQRTLTAVDSAVMVLDGAKGGSRSRPASSSRICRRRDVPIVTLVNKLDREARDPFDLLDEIEQSLALGARREPGLLADRHGARLSRHPISSPMRYCCSSAASTTGSPSRSAAGFCSIRQAGPPCCSTLS
jgi:translation elongation factor EF-4